MSNKQIGFFTKDIKERDAAAAFFKALGFKERGTDIGKYSDAYTVVYFRQDCEKSIDFAARDSLIADWISEYMGRRTFAEFMATDWYKEIVNERPPVFVKLNDEHTAEVNDREVKVGCQTIAFARVLDLAEEVRKRKQ